LPVNVRRPGWQIVAAAAGCVLLSVVVGVVASALQPQEGVNVADLMAVALTALTLAGSLLIWVRGSARSPAVSRAYATSEAGRQSVPRQLPTPVAGFVGREAQLSTLTSLLDHPADVGTPVVISAVDGMAGIGKTALAVHWSHQVADRFPDGQLYVNLRGYGPTGPPVSPAEALRAFLDALEVPAQRIPVGVEAQSSLYRSVLAGRRVLVVLDNARDAAQVRPLLPGSPGCHVLITSRSRLTSLIAAEGARPLTVELLSVAEARDLLGRRLGSGRVAAEPRAVEEIIARCAQLPLALSLVAARAATRPTFSLATVAEELREARVGDDVRAVFSWSYQQLEAAQARLFRLLALHPGPDITVNAAASLAHADGPQTRRILTELARCHLIDEPVPGRFGFHDLLRAYATELANTVDSDAERHDARQRMLDHYLHTASTANLLLHPRWDPAALSPPQPGVVPTEPVDVTAALAWFEAEYSVLLAAVEVAAAAGDRHAWQLPASMTEYFIRCGRWADWADTERSAIGAAQSAGDRRAQAQAHRSLGRALAWLGRYDEAHDELQRSLDLFQQLDAEAEQAECYMQLSNVFEQQGRPADALAHAQRALPLFERRGSMRAKCRTLNNVGWFHALTGRPAEALGYCQQALAIGREIGDRRAESNIMDSLGYAHHLLGEYEAAIDYFRRAIPISQLIGDRHSVAGKMAHLADAYHAIGDREAARASWQQALDILDQLGVVRAGTGPGYPDAEKITAELRRLGPPVQKKRPKGLSKG
jgi:tetratricopeptide (TPR) repeat protein